eukprot:4298503-Amphidinium_carterae.1
MSMFLVESIASRLTFARTDSRTDQTLKNQISRNCWNVWEAGRLTEKCVGVLCITVFDLVLVASRGVTLIRSKANSL